MTKTTVPLFMMIGLAFMLAAPAWADFQAGLDAYERGDYHTAMKEWRPLANQGDASAQYHLGVLYERAQGIPRDYQEALRLHRLAAEQGHAQAQFDLGRMCFASFLKISGVLCRSRPYSHLPTRSSTAQFGPSCQSIFEYIFIIWCAA